MGRVLLLFKRKIARIQLKSEHAEKCRTIVKMITERINESLNAFPKKNMKATIQHVLLSRICKMSTMRKFLYSLEFFMSSSAPQAITIYIILLRVEMIKGVLLHGRTPLNTFFSSSLNRNFPSLPRREFTI